MLPFFISTCFASYMRYGVLTVLLLLQACQTPESDHPAISDIIQPVRLTAGEKRSLPVSDLFYARSYDGAVEGLPQITLDYLNGDLIFSPPADAEGLYLVPLRIGGETLQLPLLVERLTEHHFRYYPQGDVPDKLTLFGEFNSWNRDNLPLQPDTDGSYGIRLHLRPGRYQYKFFLDGRELLDPQNSDSIANGLGGFNSLLAIPPRHNDRFFLHKVGMESNAAESRLRFFAEGGGEADLQVIALLGNRLVEDKYIRLNGHSIELRLPGAMLGGEKLLRVAVIAGDRSSQFQQVKLANGRPAATSDHADRILYSIMIDRFSDGDAANNQPVIHPELDERVNYKGGDFAGILQQLREGYFDSLGINTLWLSPVYQNTGNAYREYPEPHRWFSGYHGYWPIHHQQVDTRFGSMVLLKELVREARAHNIELLLDFVANHTHEDHLFFREHRDWFGTLELPDGRKNLRLWDEQRLTTWFEPYLPSFDYQGSPAALQAMTDNAVWWLKETGIAGFRHDAVKHIPNTFWRELTRKIRSEVDASTGRQTFQIGETFGSYELISSYVNHGQMDSQFNFNLFDQARRVFLHPDAGFAELDGEMQKTFAVYGVNHLMGNLMDSHDKVRYMAYADGDLSLDGVDAKEMAWSNPPQVDHAQSYQRVQLYLAWLMSIPGVPTIYYGDEIGMSGAEDPDNRRMMRFGEQLSGDEQHMLRETRRIVRLRARHSALRRGDFYTLLADEDCWIYLRSDITERVLVALNKGGNEQERTIELPAAYSITALRNLRDQSILPVTGNAVTLRLPAEDWAMWLLVAR